MMKRILCRYLLKVPNVLEGERNNFIAMNLRMLSTCVHKIHKERRHSMVSPCFSSNTALHGVLAPRPSSSTCTDKTQPVPETVNKFSERTHTCGELRVDHVGREVRLCGWLEYERMGKFLTLRDGYGSIQLVVTDSRDDITSLLEGITHESVLAVAGEVHKRPPGQENKKMSTGDIEVLVSEVVILNKAKKNLPFGVRDHNKAKEYLRMKYRYLDLRFPEMQRNLRLRSKVIMKMREYLCNYCDFVDVETPTLFRRTPGGAQEFVVPTRLAGQFFSLVQSPQQFKQLLMVGGLDRYFQIARCYRDEGSRPDRQPEFTQLDIEMSFSNREGVLSLVQELLEYCWPEHLDRTPTPFPRMTYRQAMEDYGTDKPDTRFGMKLQNVSDLVRFDDESKLRAFSSRPDCTVRALVVPGGGAHLTSSLKSKLQNTVRRQFPLTRLISCSSSPGAHWRDRLAGLFSADCVKALEESLDVHQEDALLLGVGSEQQVLELLGRTRVELADQLESQGLKARESGFHFLWVVDFPLFVAEEGALESTHHPFTQPHPDDVHLLGQEPLKVLAVLFAHTTVQICWDGNRVRSLHYDLVLNGCEVGGGSVRIHDPLLQGQVLDYLGVDQRSLQHLLDALSSGCPPHAGIALAVLKLRLCVEAYSGTASIRDMSFVPGLDRLLSLICHATSIRDVIAFPKTLEGKDPMSGAPVPISEQEQKLYHIRSLAPMDDTCAESAQ
uniref:Aminoacyl-transfer RNA synthetases class-II family profile domain-containing protein n=1 Tax=Timema bartmani TaxID=61472 RepID=A0A7R9EQ91_9NEOP|nr:unnamed protein product [Timema bartmani]